MAGLAARVVIGGVLAGVIVASRLEAGQEAPAPQPTLPQFMPLPRLTQPVQLAPSQRQPPAPLPPLNRLPPRFPQEQPLNPNGRPPLPEIWVDPYVVCGMTIIPAPPNVDPRFAKPLFSPFASRIRREPPMCSIADARPRNPDAPRNR